MEFFMAKRALLFFVFLLALRLAYQAAQTRKKKYAYQ